MGIITKTVQEDVQKVVDITCDKCGRSCVGECTNFCGISFSISGGYDSPIFPDDEKVAIIHICEYCAHEWLSSWDKNYLAIGTDTAEVVE